MKTLMMITMATAIVLVAACGKKESAVPVTTPAAFVNVEPEGIPIPIPEARKTLKPGDEVLLQGRVMGVRNPFVNGRAVFVLGDNETITPCTEMGEEDHCRTPWDACCDLVEVRASGTASIQVLDEDGKVLTHGLKGVNGLRELSRVTVKGVVAPMASAEAFVVNAKALYVAE